MNPSPAIEDTLRSTLHRHAAQPAPRADAGDVRRRVQRRRRRRRSIPALGAAAAIAAAVTVTMRQDEPHQTATAADGEMPQSSRRGFPPRGDAPPYVELVGWQVTYYVEIRATSTVDGTVQTDSEYQWTRDGQRMQLHVYPGGQATYDGRVNGDVRSDITLFGRPASLLDYGSGRYRVDVLVDTYTLEFDGEAFASAEDFLATIATAVPTDVAPPGDVVAPFIETTVGASGMPTAATAAVNEDGTTAVAPPPMESSATEASSGK